MRVIVAGATKVGRDLLRGLGGGWDVALVDPDAAALSAASNLRAVEQIIGYPHDAASIRAAGFDRADAVVAVTGDDEVNMTVCRAAVAAGVARVVALAADPEKIDVYRERGIAAVSPDRLAARRLEAVLEPRRIHSASFADGLAEAVEFRIAGDSPLRGAALGDLQADKWLVATVLRGNELIIGHGRTVLQRDDQVTVIGAASDRGLMIETFTGGVSRFPVDFGSQIVVAVGELDDVAGVVGEAAALVWNSSAEGLTVVYRRSAAGAEELLDAVLALAKGLPVEALAVDGDPERAVRAGAGAEDAGVVVVKAPRGNAVQMRFRVARLLAEVRRLGKPILVARGSHPYRRLVIQPRATPGSRETVRAAVDLAAAGAKPLVGIAVLPPIFMAEQAEADAIRAAAERLREAAGVQGITVHLTVEEGNPVRIVDRVAGDDGLLLLEFPVRHPSFLAPSTNGHILKRVRSSVLLVPGPPP